MAISLLFKSDLAGKAGGYSGRLTGAKWFYSFFSSDKRFALIISSLLVLSIEVHKFTKTSVYISSQFGIDVIRASINFWLSSGILVFLTVNSFFCKFSGIRFSKKQFAF